MDEESLDTDPRAAPRPKSPLPPPMNTKAFGSGRGFVFICGHLGGVGPGFVLKKRHAASIQERFFSVSKREVIMAEGRATGRMRVGIAAIASAILATIAAPEARAVPRACCFANGTCQVLSRAVCEDQQGGTSQAIGATCSDVECPVACTVVDAPACNGECPPTQVCSNNISFAQGATTSAVSACVCVPEIPEGGSCALRPDACAPGLTCQDGICAVPAAPAPLMSTAGLGVAVVSLLGLGGLAFVRRRRS